MFYDIIMEVVTKGTKLKASDFLRAFQILTFTKLSYIIALEMEIHDESIGKAVHEDKKQPEGRQP